MTKQDSVKQALDRLTAFNHYYKLNGGQIGLDYVEDVEVLIKALTPQADNSKALEDE